MSVWHVEGEGCPHQPVVPHVPCRHRCQHFLPATRLNAMQRHRLRLRRHQGFWHGDMHGFLFHCLHLKRIHWPLGVERFEIPWILLYYFTIGLLLLEVWFKRPQRRKSWQYSLVQKSDGWEVEIALNGVTMACILFTCSWRSAQSTRCFISSFCCWLSTRGRTPSLEWTHIQIGR